MPPPRSEPQLFRPICLRDLTVPHRLWVAAMCQYSAQDGVPGSWHAVHLGSFAVGRAGLVVTEATAVAPEGRISPQDTGLWNEDQVRAWQTVTDFARSQGVPLAVQLAHAGRKASTRSPADGRGACSAAEGGWETVGPSAVAYGDLPTPRELTTSEVRGVVQDFAAAGLRAVEAGFDAVELHAAHGYLLHQFLSPVSNLRQDEYGGSFEGRSRLLVEVVRAVRDALPTGMPLFVRISATDWVDDGWSVADTASLSVVLGQEGVDLVSVSSAGNDPRQQIPVGPGYQVPLARTVREKAGVPIGVAGLISSPWQAELALVDGAADVVFAARQFLREPTFALRAAAELGGHLEWPRQYRMARFDGSIP